MNGSNLKEEILEDLTNKIKIAAKKYGRSPGLATILIGDAEASKLYIRMKRETCKRLGIHFTNVHKSLDSSIENIIEEIQKLNRDDKIDGILLQLPLPKEFEMYRDELLKSILPDKDVDGLSPSNMGYCMMGDETFSAATPKGIMRLLEKDNIPIEGREVVIINRTTVIGKPLAMMFLKRHGTVTVCHTRTKDLDFHMKRADILVSGTSNVNFVTSDKIKDGVVIIDVGITRNAEEKLCGDVDFEGVKDKCFAITPVPGGVGPMTIAMLMENTYNTFMKRVGT
ncbi:MAG: bifunctional 5,10-methylenetetrahydrofolate dehydrogenase/5,10-methenyltetrahydrofolate cyclohydrolase [Candidatus Lokiarchaeota archaeon]|nr:bifunctional 5,10-methylenetetrahydrofolate dehydrogenase/5,10-methenyltetrahydrofolate cyclohydrolase [Candidatus Lokiarchaeota archaeon]